MLFRSKMNKKIRSFFKLSSSDVKILSFGLKSSSNFNYLDIPDPRGSSLNNSVKIYREMTDSCILDVTIDEKYDQYPRELKLSNQNILTWEDHWIDLEKNCIVDPKIERINLQKNQLVHANFNLTRNNLKYLNLEGDRKSTRLNSSHT